MTAFRIQFHVPGDVIPKQRAQVGRHGAYYPSRPRGSKRLSYPEYKELVRVQCVDQLLKAGWGWLPDDTTWGISIKARLGRGDADNVLGSVMDALQSILWADDAQVLQASVALERVTTKQERGVDVQAWVLEEKP